MKLFKTHIAIHNMEEQLISFETAKLAKEKGFFKETDNYSFTAKRNNQEGIKSVAKPIVTTYKDDYFKNENWKEYFLYPTQGTLQKWIREKYDLNVFVTPEGSLVNRGWLYHIHEYIAFRGTFGLTYEQALEEGLQQALKLI